jgi:SAM-dependent methyltransferase
VDRSATTTESTESTDLYDALAPIYDAWQAANEMRPFALVAHAKLLPQLERQARADPFAFLDLGCGTGTLLHALRAQHPGWRLAGADASRGMLAAAEAKPGSETITWARAALGAPLPFRPQFDAVGAFYDTLNHLPDEAALAAAVAAAARVLRPGGVLFFDVTNQLGFERWWRGTSRFRAAGWRLTIEAEFDPARHRGTATVGIDRQGRAESFALVERLVPEAEIEGALAAAGLVVDRREPWSPFEIDVPGKTWWVARRRLGSSG